MSNIPEWLADITVGQIFFTLVGIGAIIAAWKVVAPLVTSLRNFFEDWKGEEGRPDDGVPGRPGVMAQLKSHTEKIEQITSQVTPNSGSELKLSEEVQHLRAEVAALDDSVKSVKDQVADLSAGVKSTQADLGDHLENVPILVADILDKAQRITSEMIANNSRRGPSQPALFEDVH